MINNRIMYEKKINSVVEQDGSRHALFALVHSMVDTSGRQGGALAFDILNSTLNRSLPVQTEEIVLDVLDALSGQCHRDCWIGSGNYHLAPQAA